MSEVTENDIITLDVGGKLFRSVRKTLSKYNSKIKLILDGELEGMTGNNSIFIDLGYKHFDIILDAMRYDKLMLPANFDDIKRLRHLAEQLWFFDFIKALERNSDKFLGERRPVRYACAKVGYGEDQGFVGSLIANPDIYSKTQSRDYQHKQMSSQEATDNFFQSCEMMFQQNVVYESKSPENRFTVFAYFDKALDNEKQHYGARRRPDFSYAGNYVPAKRSNFF